MLYGVRIQSRGTFGIYLSMTKCSVSGKYGDYQDHGENKYATR